MIPAYAHPISSPVGPHIQITQNQALIVLNPKQAKKLAKQLRRWRKEYVTNGNK